MVENLKTRVLLIVGILGVALYTLVAPLARGESPFTLGLDLRGGVVLRYRLPELAAENVSAQDAEDKLAVTREIYLNRLDSTGVREFSIRSVGTDQLEVAIPGITASEASTFKNILQSVGRLEFRIEATTESGGVDVNQMREEFRAEWEAREAAGETITNEADFSNLTVHLEGEDVYFKWVPVSGRYLADYRREMSIAPSDRPEFVLLRFDTDESRAFSGEDISGVRPETDGNTGLPSVGFSIKPGRRSSEFGTFTERNIGKRMAIVLDNEVQTMPVIQSRIPGEGQITGGSEGFTRDDVRRIIAVIKSGSLPEKPVLEWENEVGPTLGEVAIDRGMKAGSLAIGLVLVFMLVYYRLSGLVACVALVVNGILLLGALALLDATLTLPGIAGLVLTVGMAVDANILIFERIREELEKGKTIPQAVKNGFERAFFAILDSNLTTLFTAYFLYRFGTSAIRGFAVVLMLGIVTSLFAALYFSRTIFAGFIERRVKALPMRQLLTRPNIPFLKYRRAGLIASGIVTLVGITAFIARGDKKYGMDFTGGYEVQLAFKEATTQADVLGVVKSYYPNAEVVSIGAGDAGPRQFQIKVKSLSEDVAEDLSGQADPANAFGEHLASLFEGRLLAPPIPDLALGATSTRGTAATFALNYAAPVGKGDVEASFGPYLADATVTGEDTGTHFAVQGEFRRPVHSEENARALIAQYSGELPALAGAGVVPLTNPMPSRSYVGPRAGVALRDAAIRAMFFSVLAVILYIRVRFHQYRYGIAAVVAVIHDALVTAGVIALVQMMGFVDVEIDLAIVAALLTIIGYSLNDTIVIFDRVRENLPRVNRPLREVLDQSMNQTLSRTILTSLTTFVVVTILFVFNLGQRNALEGFAFSMMVGIFTGTYSTIFIASPVVLAIAESVERKRAARAAAPIGPG